MPSDIGGANGEPPSSGPAGQRWAPLNALPPKALGLPKAGKWSLLRGPEMPRSMEPSPCSQPWREVPQPCMDDPPVLLAS